MYVWINDEEWAADGQPPLTEVHGWLEAVEDPGPERTYARIFGRVLSHEEQLVIVKALVAWRAQPELPDDGQDLVET